MVQLKEDEFICEKCEGLGGLIYDKPSNDLMHPAFVWCVRCNGSGKVDWVKNCIAKDIIEPTPPKIGTTIFDSVINEYFTYTSEGWRMSKTILIKEKDLNE